MTLIPCLWVNLQGVKGKKEISPFTLEEKTTFEETLEKHYPKQHPFFLTALRTGFRLGELLAL